ALQQTDFPDGIFWTPLAEINGNDPEGEMPPDGAYEVKAGEAIVRAIAAQISDELGVDLASTSQLHTYLRTRRLLLIVDNFEHLLAGADALVALLQKAPQVKMVITSRARLNLRGETVLALDRLSLPADSYHAALVAAQSDPTYAIADEVWQASEAVSMFVQRTRQVDPTFTINAATIGPVGQICRLVEGLPLGIELATSMLPVLSCTALAKDLAQSLDVLAADTRDLPRDQRTLRAVFERSWRLLTPDAQLLLARLSLFPASFPREAAEYIVGASRSLLQQLLNQSLVSKAGEERFTLHHIVHAFAQQKLQQRPEQVAAIQVQYAHYYLELLARLEPELTGAAYASATEQIEADLDNVQTAWRWALTYRMVTELNHCLTALYFFSEQQRYNWEVIDLYEEALRHLAADQAQRQEEASDETTLLIGRLQTYLGARCVRLGRFLQAQTAYESAWSILQEADHPDAAALCLGFWGGLLRRSDPHRSVDLLTEGLRLLQNTDETWLKALAYQMLGEIDLLFGNYAEAEAQLRRGYALAQQLATTRGLVSALKSLGRISLCLGHYRQAEAHLREAIGYARQYHLNLLRLESTTALGEALRLQGRIDDAQQCFVESRTISKELDAEVFIAAVLLWEEACLAEQCGQYATAKRQFSESLAIGLPPWWSHVLPTLGWALIGLDELDEGYAYFQAVLAKAQSEERLPVVLDARVGLICIEWLRSLQSRPANPAWVAETQSALHELDRHPATAAETRQRIAQIVQQFAPHLPEKPSAEAPDAFLNRPWQTATHPQSGSPTVVDTPG
ncbi:MAG TPA: hypothetical protein PKE45_16095, partial [Caldilineaceae bacterium]|nr:hypothetical protein [Caldilineaceae bacterium]